MDKCGYDPKTQVKVDSDKLCHDFLEGEEKINTYLLLLNNIEKQNKEAIQFLLDNGYDLAYKLRHRIKWVSVEQQVAPKCTTGPNTLNYCTKHMKVLTAC